MTKPRKKAETALILKTLPPTMEAHGGFVWPTEGVVRCKRWNPAPECGDGLHGLLWGEGDALLLHQPAAPTTRWVIFSADASTVVDLGGKVKVPEAAVVFVGDRHGALGYLESNGGAQRATVFASRTAGHRGTATAGDWGTATAGDWGTATAGDWGTATAGDWGTATAGHGGTATAGDWGTATAGRGGTATAGHGGTATAGHGGAVQVRWWDDSKERHRIVTGYVGEDGIEADVPYRVDPATHLLVKAEVTK